MVSLTYAFVAATAVLSALALPANQGETHVKSLQKRTTPNASGCSNGYWYQFCKSCSTDCLHVWGDANSPAPSGSEGGGGQVTYTNKAAGQYTVNWSNCKDFTAGKGWRNATGR